MSTTNNKEEKILELPLYLKKLIDEAIERAIDVEFVYLKERVEKRRAEIIAGVVVSLYKQVDVDTNGNTLKISFKLEK